MPTKYRYITLEQVPDSFTTVLSLTRKETS